MRRSSSSVHLVLGISRAYLLEVSQSRGPDVREARLLGVLGGLPTRDGWFSVGPWTAEATSASSSPRGAPESARSRQACRPTAEDVACRGPVAKRSPCWLG